MSGKLSDINVASHPEGGWVLGVMTKRTYSVVDGHVSVADAQVPLVEGAQYDDQRVVLLHDSDYAMNRTRVDVVVSGHAWAPVGVRSFEAAIALGNTLRRTVVVTGDRGVWRDSMGNLRFHDAAPFEKVPLDWQCAYGGYDAHALARHGDPFAELHRAMGLSDIPQFTVFAYPRNPAGRGYLIEATEESLAACQLPNLEVPGHLLTPETLVRGEFTRWPGAPPVATMGWLSYNFFPRICTAGLPPMVYDDETFPPHSFWEVQAGEVRENTVRPNGRAQDRTDIVAAQGSAVGMRAASAMPGDLLSLLHLHPRHARWSFALPSEWPRVVVQLPDVQPEELVPAIRTLWLDPDADRLCVTWVANRRLSRPLSDTQWAQVRHAVEWR